MTREIYFATSNLDKCRELHELLQIPVHRVALDLQEIQSLDVREVVEAKARQAYLLAGKAVLVEDTGLSVRAWGGLPGPLVTWFIQTVGTDGLCRMMKDWTDREATAVTVFGSFDGTALRTFDGEVRGEITGSPRGSAGFGWDPIFRPHGSPKTYAEMTPVEKNSASPRKLAVEKLRAFLKEH